MQWWNTNGNEGAPPPFSDNDFFSRNLPGKAANVISPDAVDRLLSDELKQLSLLDRERLLEEIHGVRTGAGVVSLRNEDNEKTQQQLEDEALIQFQAELNRIYLSELAKSRGNHLSAFKYPAYHFALQHGSELIRDREFRLRFLGRSDARGDGGLCPQKGALRMLSYLESIREIYDCDDVLFRPICLVDLNTGLGAKEFMYENGPIQMLPVRDPSGRRVFLHLRDFGPESCSAKVRSQVGMYFVQTIAEDRDGAVFVFFLHRTQNNLYDAEEFRAMNRLLEIIPPKFNAVHVCCPKGPMFEIMRAAVALLLGKANRERLRFHIGSYHECKYALRPFGIPVDRLPMDLNVKRDKGERKQYQDITIYKKWLRVREAKETTMFAAIGRDCNGQIKNPDANYKSIGESYLGVMAIAQKIRSQFIECPRHEDCLFGKGRPPMYHPGNVAMRRLISEKIDRFEAATSRKKQDIVREVIEEIEQCSGRFLREDYDHASAFVLAEDETVYKKVATGFRDLKKRRCAKKDQEKSARDNTGNESSSSSQTPKQSNRGKKRPATETLLTGENERIATASEREVVESNRMALNLSSSEILNFPPEQNSATKQRNPYRSMCLPGLFQSPNG